MTEREYELARRWPLTRARLVAEVRAISDWLPRHSQVFVSCHVFVINDAPMRRASDLVATASKHGSTSQSYVCFIFRNRHQSIGQW